jgi:hypothetical protein
MGDDSPTPAQSLYQAQCRSQKVVSPALCDHWPGTQANPFPHTPGRRQHGGSLQIHKGSALSIPLQLHNGIDASVSCMRCDAVCCRLTVVVMPDDVVPRRYVERNAHGVDVMAHDEDGWCVAIDPVRMRCSIYEQRPDICRKFAMGSEYCREEREAYRTRHDGDPAHGSQEPH